MKQATITITDDLEQAIESYRQDFDIPSGLDAIIQRVLRIHLANLGYLSGLGIDEQDVFIPGIGSKPTLLENAPTLLDGSTVAEAVIEDRR